MTQRATVLCFAHDLQFWGRAPQLLLVDQAWGVPVQVQDRALTWLIVGLAPRGPLPRAGLGFLRLWGLGSRSERLSEERKAGLGLECVTAACPWRSLDPGPNGHRAQIQREGTQGVAFTVIAMK